MREIKITIISGSRSSVADALEEIALSFRNRPTIEDGADLREWEDEEGTLGYQVEVTPATMDIYGNDIPEGAK